MNPITQTEKTTIKSTNRVVIPSSLLDGGIMLNFKDIFYCS